VCAAGATRETKALKQIRAMEAAAVICFYSLFCCALCVDEQKPLTSEPKITVNPVVRGEDKGPTVKNEP
jgi:hypothetical protein